MQRKRNRPFNEFLYMQFTPLSHLDFGFAKCMIRKEHIVGRQETDVVRNHRYKTRGKTANKRIIERKGEVPNKENIIKNKNI